MKGELEVKDMVNGTSETMFPGNDQSDASIRAYFTQYENGGTLFLILRDHIYVLKITKVNQWLLNAIGAVPVFSLVTFPHFNRYVRDCGSCSSENNQT